VESVGTLIPFLLILVFFWLLIIRPARSRQRAQQRLQEQLVPGQEVMTTSGLIAKVAALEDDAIVLEPSPGVTLRYTRQAVARVLPADEPEPEQIDDAAETDDVARTDAVDGEPDTDREADREAKGGVRGTEVRGTEVRGTEVRGTEVRGTERPDQTS
jgi:preprotein translocase subunit YajC